jgi:hypothetical protein
LKNLLIEGLNLEWLLGSAIAAMRIANEPGLIRLTKPALERLFGVPAHKLLRQSVQNLIASRMGQPPRRLVRRRRERGRARLLGPVAPGWTACLPPRHHPAPDRLSQENVHA